MLKKYQILEGKLAESQEDLSPIWVYIDPNENEKKNLVQTLQVDEHTLNSALDPDELSRLEFEPHHTALILKRPKNFSSKKQLLFKVTSTGLFLFKDQLIVLTSEEVPLFVERYFYQIQSLEDVFLKLIYGSIHHYLEHLKVITMITDEIERKINISMENKHLLNLFSLEKSLVYYLNAISSNNTVFEKLRNNAGRIGFSQKGAEFLDDVIIENGQCYKQAEIYSNILANLMDARVSVVSNNLNILMKRLNVITIGIMVPTLVVSIFSMNVTLPLQQYPFAFWIILAFSGVSLGLVLFWWFKGEW